MSPPEEEKPWVRRRREREEQRQKLVEDVTKTLSDRESPTGAAPWVLAELMVASLHTYESTFSANHSTANWAPPGHQGHGVEINKDLYSNIGKGKSLDVSIQGKSLDISMSARTAPKAPGEDEEPPPEPSGPSGAPGQG